MAVVLVTGGAGVLGSHVASLMRQRSHEVRTLSRRAGAGTHRGDLSTGEGIAAATAGAELIVHAASDTRRRGRTDLEQTRRLLAAAAEARHLLYISIVGIDDVPLRYYRNKLACEREIAAATVPHTILRATQFHELLATGLRAAERLPIAPLPLDWRLQSVAAREVALRIADLLDGDALGRAPDFGGPEVLGGREIVSAWRGARRRPRAVFNFRLPGRVSAGFRAGMTTCPDHRDGRETWKEFVSALE